MDFAHRIYFSVFNVLIDVFSTFSIPFSKSETSNWNAESSTACYTAWCRITSLPVLQGPSFFWRNQQPAAVHAQAVPASLQSSC